jgi:uncharacterized repeat protein (TIGR03803 family)
MRISTSNVIGACLSAAILTACGGNTVPSSSTPTSVARSQPASGPYAAHGVTEKVLHGFTGGSDGAAPVNMILADVKGVLYGVTEQGGGSGCLSGNGCGTVFKLSTSGAESVLYSFKGTPDGQNAKGGVVERSGVLYGTTQGGGKYGGGTFFKITTSGKETVLHSFGNPGYYGPYAGVIYVAANDMFYGTTLDGGTGTCGTSGLGCGTVFSVTPSGKETVLHSFQGGQDGHFPTGSLLYSNGKLYGTTELGGGGGGSLCGSSDPGCGTIFSVSTSGTEKVLYSFTDGADGAYPDGGLIDVNGTRYGMAGGGGGGGCSGGCGTIFSLSASGAFDAIHSFQGPPNDGASPWGNLTNVKGVLYGTTDQGGASTACAVVSGTTGCGAIFRVTTSGKEDMLYSFEGSPDGAWANTTLLYMKGVLYGTTIFGGSGSCTRAAGNGCGTVFSLSGF